MDNGKINGVALTPLKIINTPGGEVLHGMKEGDPGYSGFGEAYFSKIKLGEVKGWKRHKRMYLNIVVPVGSIKFFVYDDRGLDQTSGRTYSIILSTQNYFRLTIPPMVWLAFLGLGEQENILLNLASIKHDVNEVDRKSMQEIPVEIKP